MSSENRSWAIMGKKKKRPKGRNKINPKMKKMERKREGVFSQSFLKSKLLVFLFLLTLPVAFAEGLTYKVYYSFIPAGKIELNIKNSTAIVKGKSGSIVGWFYHYRLYMVYNLKNETESFMREEENGKRRFYNFKLILKKKPWLPVMVKVLLRSEGKKLPETLKVGNLEIRLLKRNRNSYTYRVFGSKKVKEVFLKFGKARFPEEIDIETKRGEIKLELKR
jgi:hypothetical protein